MLDIKFLRENPDLVKENIKKKFQDQKLPLVDEVIVKDRELRTMKQRVDDLRAQRNAMSKQIGGLMKEGKRDEAEAVKQQVASMADELKEIEEKEAVVRERVQEIMMQIPNMIDPSVPIGKDDSENVELEKFGEPVVPAFEIPYHTDHGEIQWHRSRQRQKSCRKRFLLFDGRYRASAQCSHFLCP